MTRHLFRSLPVIVVVILSFCVYLEEAGAHSAKKLKREVDAAVSEMDDRLDTCRKSLETNRRNNDLLIETNARLSSKLDAGKLDLLASGEDLKGRLSECEFRTTELEDTITDKQSQIGLLELEVERYSLEVRQAIEESQAVLDRQKADQAELDAQLAELDFLADEFAVEFENLMDSDDAAFELVKGSFQRYVSIMFRNSLLFKPGGVVLSRKGRGLLKRVYGALKSLDRFEDWAFTVIGHTDVIAPGKTLSKSFPSNWEMSQARAVNVLHYLVDTEGFPPFLIGAMGYGEHRPVASNETLQGRAKNLRIIIRVEPVKKMALPAQPAY